MLPVSFIKGVLSQNNFFYLIWFVKINWLYNITSRFLVSDDPSLPVIQLMKVLYALNNHWTDLYQVPWNQYTSWISLDFLGYSWMIFLDNLARHSVNILYLSRAWQVIPSYQLLILLITNSQQKPHDSFKVCVCV